jgi:hypothetical protein
MKYKVTITPQVGKPHSSIHGSIEAAREYTETWERHFCTTMTEPIPYYERDGITIYHGDCREVLPLIAPGSVDLVLTDPPYGIGWSRGVHTARNSKSHDGILNDHDTSTRDAALALVADVPAIVFGSFYAPYPANVRQVLIWQKPGDAGVVGSTTGFRRDAEPVFLVGPWPQRHVRWSSVLASFAGSISAVATETGHPHTKPLAMIRDLLERTQAETVLDPFMGSGTTLRAAKDLGRKAIGIEIEERYCEIAAKRLAQEVLDLWDAG